MAILGGIDVTFELTGNVQLDRNFQELGSRVQKKVLREGTRDGAKIIQARAVANIPKRSGVAAASLKVRAGKRSRSTPDLVQTLVITAGGWFKGTTFYIAFGELGWKIGSRKTYTFVERGQQVRRWKLGFRWIKERKPIAGKHWIESAYQSDGEQAKTKALDTTARGIEREAAALGQSG